MKITKDDSIISLLRQLSFLERGWTIRDYWEADLCAIGISSQHFPNKVVYVSTYGMANGRYSYECEQLRANAKDPSDYDIVDEGADVDFHELVAAMQRHLDRAA